MTFHFNQPSTQVALQHNNALVRTQTTLRFVCAAQLGRYVNSKTGLEYIQCNYSGDILHYHVVIYCECA